MFTIIGGDGQEYGPATAQQVRSWIAAGRANLATQAREVGTDEWRRLGDFAEFAAPGEVPPVLAGAEPSVESSDVDTASTAERWRRLLGAIADGLLESLAWIPTSAAVGHSLMEMVNSNQLDPQEIIGVFKTALPLSLPYLGALVILQAVLLTLRGQSVGNLLVRTRIVRADNGEPAGFLRAFLLRGALARVIRQVPFVGGIFWIVDSCFIFREDKRCLHDLIARTKVVKV